ncbi:transposase [Streptomyces tauricus]|uniref:Mutator family transposase n=1 Tax=Streptomyces tauricus TaxID=68274 RepID=A0ABZ1JTX3_9ACTN
MAAICTVFLGSAWQRCRVHFVRDVFPVVEKGSGEMVAATIRTIFTQTTGEQVRTQLDMAADMLGRQLPQVKKMLLDAATDITAFADFPPAYWKKIWSTNPAGTAESGDQTTGRRRPGLPQPRRPGPTRRCGPGRTPRRMACLRPPLPLPSLHGRTLHHPGAPTRAADHAATGIETAAMTTPLSGT